MMWLDYVSFISAIVSVAGFILTLWQVWGIKKKISDAAEDARKRLREVLDLSQISKTIKLIEQIQANANSRKWDLAMSQMQELHSVLIQISSKEDLRKFVRDDFDTGLMTMPSNMNKINELCKGTRNDDLRTLFLDLQKIKDNLLIIDAHLK